MDTDLNRIEAEVLMPVYLTHRNHNYASDEKMREALIDKLLSYDDNKNPNKINGHLRNINLVQNSKWMNDWLEQRSLIKSNSENVSVMGIDDFCYY